MNHPASPRPSTLQPAAAGVGALTHIREFLAFKIANEEYGVDILRVQEIRSYESPPPLPMRPSISRAWSICAASSFPSSTCASSWAWVRCDTHHLTVVIVLNIGNRVIGVVVDGVSDVLTLEPSQLRPVPALDSNFDPEHILAIGSVDERMLILLDIEKFLADTVLGEATVAAH